jgi:tripartite ATP-independent transporter DctM subunit
MIGIVFLCLVALIALAVPIGVALGVLGLITDRLFSTAPMTEAMGQIVWNGSRKYELVAVPLFVLMGELFLRSGLARKMYATLDEWLSWLPGGLMHSNIGACAMFAATSGSSVATAASIGTVALPEMRSHGYNERLFLGSLAAGGTLGILIPPSINMIVYGVLTDTSIPQLYLAGFIPGLILTVLFMATIVVCCRLVPKWGGVRRHSNWRARFASLPHLLPPLGLFVVVVGSIYMGFATPTEAAAIGVAATVVIAAFARQLSLTMLRNAFVGAMRTTCMVMFIVVGALFLNFILVATGGMASITGFVEHSGLSPTWTMLLIIGLYIVLGCFMDALAMVITTVPIITPIVVHLGYDPVWFGIIIVLVTETSLITPPIGVNLFVIQSIRGRGPISDVIIGSAPFVVTMMVMIAVIFLFPMLALWMPTLFYR